MDDLVLSTKSRTSIHYPNVWYRRHVTCVTSLDVIDRIKVFLIFIGLFRTSFPTCVQDDTYTKGRVLYSRQGQSKKTNNKSRHKVVV